MATRTSQDIREVLGSGQGTRLRSFAQPWEGVAKLEGKNQLFLPQCEYRRAGWAGRAHTVRRLRGRSAASLTPWSPRAMRSARQEGTHAPRGLFPWPAPSRVLTERERESKRFENGWEKIVQKLGSNYTPKTWCEMLLNSPWYTGQVTGKHGRSCQSRAAFVSVPPADFK